MARYVRTFSPCDTQRRYVAYKARSFCGLPASFSCWLLEILREAGEEPTAPLDEEEKGAPSHQKSSPHRPEDTDYGWERVSGVSPHRSASNHDHWLSDRRDFGGRREVDVLPIQTGQGGQPSTGPTGSVSPLGDITPTRRRNRRTSART